MIVNEETFPIQEGSPVYLISKLPEVRQDGIILAGIIHPAKETGICGTISVQVTTRFCGDIWKRKQWFTFSLFTLPGAKKTNYVLEGWYTEKNGKGEKLTTDTVIRESRTWYANWVSLFLTGSDTSSLYIYGITSIYCHWAVSVRSSVTVSSFV